MIGSAYSDETLITTTKNGSPIDNLRESIDQFESASKEKLDKADAEKNHLVSTMNEAEKKFLTAKTGGLERISDLSDKISLDFVGVQQKSNG